MEDIRERLVEMIKMMPEDKLQVVLDFVNHLYHNQDGEEPDDELLMS